MNCESEEEVRKRITDDMKQFNKDALANYKEYDTIFQDNLLTPYKNNLVELQKLYEQTSQLVNAINGLWVNNNNNMTYDQLLADSAAMLNASSEEEFWNLAAQRDAKAALRGLDTTGADSRYRSNDEFYKLWAANHKDLATYSHQNKQTLDADNDFWKAYNQTDSSLKNDSVKTTDDYVNKMCKEWVNYNNQYNSLLNQGMDKNNSQLQNLAQKMSDIQDQIAQRMQLSVEEIQTIGAQMVAAQEQVYTNLAEAIQKTQEAYEKSLLTGSSVELWDGLSIDANKKNYTSGKDYIQNDDGTWTDLHTGQVSSSKPSGANSSNSTSSAWSRDDSSGGSGYWSGKKSSSDMRSEVEKKLEKSKKTGSKVDLGGGVSIDYSKIKNKSYSTGIENGPVTYTGLAMLHGTPGNPEFVLNSDQAYTLLRNMATTKLPEMQKVSGGEAQSTQYIVQGDIVLENTNNPAQFWDDVSKAMSNRHNVTKNR